ETIIEDAGGNAVRITDFIPRFNRYERTFHPPQLIRRIEPIRGLPRVRIRVRPCFNYGTPCTTSVLGSNHIRYTGGRDTVRLTTDASLSYIAQETAFALTHPVTLILGPDEPLTGSIDAIAREFFELTQSYWLGWVRALAIPLEWQEEVIRAAITLKLCSFDETGAIVAALTTSIPEAPGSLRNWDYRFCWLRDAYFVIKALNRLGATHTMESFINYITTIAIDAERPLKPVYGIVPDEELIERVVADLSGFDGAGTVRIGNQASEQTQHDAYGSVILGAAQMFIDERLPRRGDASLFHRLEPLGEQAIARIMEPDAGIWEYRGRREIYTHSATMCWVAADRLAKIAGLLALGDRERYWRSAADKMGREILARAWSDRHRALMGALGGNDFDASVLLLPDLGLIQARDPRFISTCDAIGRELKRNGYIMRYTATDDFGTPETAFLACQFWYIDAQAQIGNAEAARELFVDLLS
ncbi:MAG: glycoside hydrolase family 15 protein, partial [Proteobacteria bacterium]|nr:glycoside hydrolase family 15 protein [Pseudomonadota bacterium]